ncbi:MAG: hypothetical protein ACODAD_07345 [Planctomycetota bacterium]
MWRTHSFQLALVLVFTASARGQDAPTEQSPPSAKPAPEATRQPDEKPPSAKDSATASPLPEEHVIYVPYDKKLLEVFEDEESSVVLPYAQFLEMWNRLTESDQRPREPPVNGVITRAAYAGSVRGELARLEATLDIEVLSAGWARLPMEFGDAAIGSARTEDGAALLRGVGNGRYELLVEGKGKHQIKLGLVVEVKTGTEGRSFAVQCPAVGVSSLDLDIPEKNLAVQVTPRRTCEIRSDQEDATGVRAVLGATSKFAVSWQPTSGAADQAAGLADVTDTITVDVGDGVVHTHAMFDYEILRGAISQLVLDVPADHRVLDVQVPGLRDWQTEKVEDRQRVKVQLHAPVMEKIRLELNTESTIAEEAFQVGNLHAVGVARESGILAVRGAEDVGLEYVQRESIKRVDAADVPESLRKPRSRFYKFFTPDHRLSVIVSQLKPRIIVGSHISVLLKKSRVTAHGEFRYEISRSGVFNLTFLLPAGFQIDDVRAESMERFEVAETEEGQTLTVYFTKEMLGELTVAVVASQMRDGPAGELTLPLPEPLSTTRERGLVAVVAPESLEVKTDSAQLQSARPATPGELAAKGLEPTVPAGATLAAAFSFVTRPVSIVQTITQRPRRTAVVVSTVADVKEDVVRVATTFRYKIQFAGTDTFRIAVPEDASGSLRIEGDGIKERRKADQLREDGTVEWTVVLHSEAMGDYAFTATYDQEISVPDQGVTVELQPMQALDVDREAGEIAIEKDRVLAVDAETMGLEEIDPRELWQPTSATQPYLAYRYYEHPAQLVLSVTKHELQEVVETIVRRAYIEAVVTEEGPITMRARYDLKTSERQRLAVTLRNPRILGITVAGQSIAPEKGPDAAGGEPEDETYLINVARTTGSDEPFQIGMVFETPSPWEQLGVTDRLDLPLPRFSPGVKFQRVYVRAWVPQDYRLVGDPEGFTSHIGVGLWDSRRITPAPDNPDSWFPDDTSAFDFQVGGTTYLFSSMVSPADLQTDYWHIPTMTLIASSLVLAVGVMLVPFSLDTKVFSILAVVLGLSFVGMFVPSVVNSWLLAGRLGIAGVIALWLVAWLLHIRRGGYSLQWLVEAGSTVLGSAGNVSRSEASQSSGADGESRGSAEETESDDEQASAAGSRDNANSREDAGGSDEAVNGQPEDEPDDSERGSHEQ